MQWELITNIILITSILIVAIFAFIGLYQWITHRSIKKVDKELRWMPLPLTLMVAVYFIFDKLIVLATRPNGSGEPSFPSTHVMVVATIFFLLTIILPKYVKSKAMQIILEIVMIALISITCTGRVLSDMHSITDVLGGLGFAFIFATIYYLIIVRRNKKHA